jgi:hypothetical protein
VRPNKRTFAGILQNKANREPTKRTHCPGRCSSGRKNEPIIAIRPNKTKGSADGKRTRSGRRLPDRKLLGLAVRLVFAAVGTELLHLETLCGSFFVLGI